MDCQLGASDHSVVYKAFDSVGGESVAIKYIPGADTAERTAGLREVSLLLSLDHENLVKCLDIQYTKSGGFVIVYEYIESGDLRRFIDDGQQLSLSEWCSFARQLFSGLAYLSQREIVHCDLKPENVLICESQSEGRLPIFKIADFGVAHFHDATQRVLTKGAGSPAYMSPEAFTGCPSYAADVYSAGIILYEIVTGVRPFNGSIKELARAHAQEPPDLTQIPWGGARVLLSLFLQKRAAHRISDYATILEMLRNLEADPDMINCGAPDEVAERPQTKFSFITADVPDLEPQLLQLDSYEAIGAFAVAVPFDFFEPVFLAGVEHVLLGDSARLNLYTADTLSPKGIFYFTNERPVQLLRTEGFVISNASQLEIWNTDGVEPQQIEPLGIRVDRAALDESSGMIAWCESSRVFFRALFEKTTRSFLVPDADESSLRSISFWNSLIVLIQGHLNPSLTAMSTTGEVLHRISLPGPIIQASPYGSLEFLCWSNGPDSAPGPTVVSLGQDFSSVTTTLNDHRLSFSRYCMAGAILCAEDGSFILRDRFGEFLRLGGSESMRGKRLAYSPDATFFYLYSESMTENNVYVYAKKRS